MAVVLPRDRGDHGQHFPRPARAEARTRNGDAPPRRQGHICRGPIASGLISRELNMTPARKRRLYWVLGIVAGVGIAAALALSAFEKNVMFFFDPTQVAAGEVKEGQR